MQAYWLFLIAPLVASLLALLGKKRWWFETVTLVSSVVVGVTLLLLYRNVISVDTSLGLFSGTLMVDPLSFFFLGIIGLIGFSVTLYSIGYVRVEEAQKEMDAKQVKLYYVLYNVFLFAMSLAASSNNLGVLWVGVEATTLASAFLVGLYRHKQSVEAAWKYVVMSSVGLSLALAGTVLLYLSGVHAGGEAANSLLWTELHRLAASLDPELVKVAFVFLLVGYGTKIGLAPMHTWLPDAHGKAPTPISALLSAVLLNIAVMALIRVKMIADPVVGSEFTGTLMYILGFLSVGIAAFSILRQENYKRLFAYSSVENMGLIVIGLALATPLGVFAALFQIINHSLAKSFSFFAAGNVLLKYHSTKISNIQNLMKLMPMTGLALMLAAAAMTGFPPFSIFLSKFSLLWGLSDAPGWMLWLLLGLLVLVSGGFFYNIMRMVFSHQPSAKLTDDEGHLHEPESFKIPAWNSVAMVLNGSLMVSLGVVLPLGLTIYLAGLTEWILSY